MRVSLWYPHGVYSRVEIVNVPTGPGAANEGMALTPPVGNECWLRRVQVYVHQLGEVENIWGYVRLCFGSDGGASVGDVRDEWSRIIRSSGMGLKDEIYVYDKGLVYDWPMNMHFSAAGLMFALYAHTGNPAKIGVFTASFEFTEG